MQVNILESKNRLSELVRRAQQGEEVYIANRGMPVVRLTPVNPSPEPTRNVVEWLKRNPLPDTVRRSAAEIDAGITQEREGWD